MKRYRLIMMRAAQNDLKEIAAYIAEDRPQAARNVVRRIRERINALRTSPFIGAPRDEVVPGFRVVVVYSYLIVHDVSNETVRIVRVLHGARDLSSIDWQV